MEKFRQLSESATNFSKDLGEEEAILLIAHSVKECLVLVCAEGNSELLSLVMSNDNGYVNIENKEIAASHKNTREYILNIAINILRKDKNYRDKFMNALIGLM